MAAGAAGGDPGDSAFRISGSSASFPKLGLECWHIRGCFSSASCGCSPSLLHQTWLRNVACPPGTSQWWSASHPLWRYRASSPGTGPKACFFLLIHRGNAYYKKWFSPSHCLAKTSDNILEDKYLPSFVTYRPSYLCHSVTQCEGKDVFFQVKKTWRKVEFQ